MLTNPDREHETLQRFADDLSADGPTSKWHARTADDGDGLQVMIAGRNFRTGEVSAISTQVDRTLLIQLIPYLAREAGLPDPWDGRTIR